jgi:hypothetical protein
MYRGVDIRRHKVTERKRLERNVGGNAPCCRPKGVLLGGVNSKTSELNRGQALSNN